MVVAQGRRPGMSRGQRSGIPPLAWLDAEPLRQRLFLPLLGRGLPDAAEAEAGTRPSTGPSKSHRHALGPRGGARPPL